MERGYMPDDKKSILVIDDEEGACDFIKSFLEGRDYIVFTALNGPSGINIIKEKKPSLVFLDVRMPDMTGIDVLKTLKDDHINIKVILMTGIEAGEELDKAKELGISGIINKPVQLQALSEILKQNT